MKVKTEEFVARLARQLVEIGLGDAKARMPEKHRQYFATGLSDDDLIEGGISYLVVQRVAFMLSEGVKAKGATKVLALEDVELVRNEVYEFGNKVYPYAIRGVAVLG